jgi:hypothetical protein
MEIIFQIIDVWKNIITFIYLFKTSPTIKIKMGTEMLLFCLFFQMITINNRLKIVYMR